MDVSKLNTKGDDFRIWIVFLIVIFIAILEAFGQTFIKKARTKEIISYVFIGALFYLGVVALLFMSYKYDGMGNVNLVWSIISIILAIGTGYYIFEEKINKYTIITLILAIITLYFAHKAREENE